MTNELISFGVDSIPREFHSGVSLHSHTFHSQESLAFVYKAAAGTPLLAALIRAYEQRYRSIHRAELDLSRGWWTPPLSPRDAWSLELQQIQQRLHLNPLASLTDHDTIEAAVKLRVIAPGSDIPVSVEWTVPFGESFLHVGVHNLPPAEVNLILRELAAYTSRPAPGRLRELLCWLDAFPEVLLVLNHPAWDEQGIGWSKHTALVSRCT